MFSHWLNLLRPPYRAAAAAAEKEAPIKAKRTGEDWVRLVSARGPFGVPRSAFIQFFVVVVFDKP